MNQDFTSAWERFKFLKLKDLVALYRICSFKSFKKGELLAKEGEYCQYAFLITKGILRTYVLTNEAEERTIRLAKEKEFTSAGQSFLHGKSSTEYIEALEDCKVIAINTKKLNKLSQENIRILRLAHTGLKEAFSESIKRVEFFTIYTPKQRYESLFQTSPELLQRVPQKYLASYLGITTVSLSRIRNRK